MCKNRQVQTAPMKSVRSRSHFCGIFQQSWKIEVLNSDVSIESLGYGTLSRYRDELNLRLGEVISEELLSASATENGMVNNLVQEIRVLGYAFQNLLFHSF